MCTDRRMRLLNFSRGLHVCNDCRAVVVQADLPVDYEKAAERYLKASDAKNAEVSVRVRPSFQGFASLAAGTR